MHDIFGDESPGQFFATYMYVLVDVVSVWLHEALLITKVHEDAGRLFFHELGHIYSLVSSFRYDRYLLVPVMCQMTIMQKYPS